MSTDSKFTPAVGSPALLTRRGNNELTCHEATVTRITPSGMVVISYGDPKTERRYYKPKWGGEWREHGESLYSSYRWAVFFDNDIGPERERTAAVLAEQKVMADVRTALARLAQTRIDHYHPPTEAELKALRERMAALSYAVTAAETWRGNNPTLPPAEVVGATTGEDE